MRSDASKQRRWLNDILENIRLAESFTEGLGYEAFAGDQLRFYATVRCLEIISEASRRLSEACKERHPAIDWLDMASSGNVYRHEYRAVAAGVVWSTLTDYLPQLKSAVEIELSDLSNDTSPEDNAGVRP